jgi:hypothetical protein
VPRVAWGWVLLGCLAWILPVPCGATGDAERAAGAFAEGVEQYEQKHHAAAFDKWRRVLLLGYGSPDLFLNLGNAAYRLGDLGWAVYYYELARRRSPRDPDVLSNLQLARREALGEDYTADDSPVLQWIVSLQNRWSLSGAVRLLSIAFWVGAGMIVISWQARVARRRQQILRGLAVGLLLVVGLLVGVKILQSSLMPEAIAVEPLAVRSEPLAEATVEFRLPAGSPLDLDRSSPGWREVVVSRSLRGWVEDRSVARFADPTPPSD